jgi:hypothetical protein
MNEETVRMHLMQATMGKVVHYSQIPDDGGPILVICGREHGGLIGAKQTKGGCGALMRASPETQRLMATRTGPVDLLCFECATKMFATRGEN